MLNILGEKHGSYQGQSHADQGLKRRPRPSLSISVLSKGYMNAFFSAYSEAYAKHKTVRKQRQHRLTANGVPLPNSRELQNQKEDFDKGWQDGFRGRVLEVDQSSSAMERGYQLGQRDKDFQRAKELRAKVYSQQKLAKSQDEFERDI